MRHSTKIALSTLAIAIGSTLVHAQQPTEDDLNPQNRNPVGTQQGSQLDNDSSTQRGDTTQQRDSAQRSGQQDDANPAQLARQENMDSSTQSAMTLERLAMMKPEELAGKTLTNDDGEEIGEIERIALKRDDQSAYAVINTKNDNKAAVRLGELQIGALAYTRSADTLGQQQYQSSEYERFDQSSTDPRGNPGLQNSAGASAGNAGSSASNTATSDSSRSTAGNDTSPSSNTTAGSSTSTGSNTASTLGQTAAEGASIVGQLDGSLVEQLAMMQPGELEGVKLKSESGEALGEIDHVAKRRNDDQIVAVIDLEEGSDMAVVPIDYLQLSAVRYDGDADDLEEQSFDESEFQRIAAQ